METRVTQQTKPKTYTEALKILLKREAECWYDVAKCCYEIYRREEWKLFGYASCRQYVLAELEKYGVNYQTFMYRVKIGEALEVYGIKKSQVAELGWAKFKDIASYLFAGGEEELDEIIEMAKEMSSRELHRKIQELKMKKQGIEREPIRTLNFRLLESQAVIVAQALELAEELCQTDNPSLALAYVCADFLMNHSTDDEVINKLRAEILKTKQGE